MTGISNAIVNMIITDLVTCMPKIPQNNLALIHHIEFTFSLDTSSQHHVRLSQVVANICLLMLKLPGTYSRSVSLN